MSKSTKLNYRPNDFVVYPAHGVGKIISIEEQEIAGMTLELFVGRPMHQRRGPDTPVVQFPNPTAQQSVVSENRIRPESSLVVLRLLGPVLDGTVVAVASFLKVLSSSALALFGDNVVVVRIAADVTVKFLRKDRRPFPAPSGSSCTALIAAS